MQACRRTIFIVSKTCAQSSITRRTNMTKSLEIVVEKNVRSAELISSLKIELSALRSAIVTKKIAEMKTENMQLRKQIEAAKSQLIALENRNGKKQYPVPGARTFCTTSTLTNDAKLPNAEEATKSDYDQQPKEKKPKKEKCTSANTTASVAAEAPVDIGRLDLRIGKIVEISRHPDADSLYLEKIDCGEGQPRTVISGLVKYVPIEEMQNRMVVVLCNLKPAKMRGISSEAMVMCASTLEKVEVLSPPDGTVPGELVHCEGYERRPDAQLNPKKKVFETCAPDLQTNEQLVACYKGAYLHVPGKGKILSQTLKNVQVK